jgi:uncharacterized protein (UPF0216 family)
LGVASGFERLIKGIEYERARSRQSVPRAKKATLLLGEASPHFVCKDGAKYPVDRRDLDKLVAVLDADQVQGLALPIYLRTAPSLGHGFYQLLGVESGTEMERKQSKILFGLLGAEPRNYLYSYEVQRLKRVIPSLIHIFY